MERARTEWMRTLGFEQDQLLSDAGILFAVRSARLEFLQPARFNDQLTVSVAIAKRGRASLTINQAIARDTAAQPLCTGEIKIACVSAASFKPHPIPDNILQEIADGN